MVCNYRSGPHRLAHRVWRRKVLLRDRRVVRSGRPARREFIHVLLAGGAALYLLYVLELRADRFGLQQDLAVLALLLDRLQKRLDPPGLPALGLESGLDDRGPLPGVRKADILVMRADRPGQIAVGDGFFLCLF